MTGICAATCPECGALSGAVGLGKPRCLACEAKRLGLSDAPKPAMDVEAVLAVAEHLAACCDEDFHGAPMRQDVKEGEAFTAEYGCCCHIAGVLRKACGK